MTDFSPRLFRSDAEIIRLGEGLLACDLAKEDWTHEAHLAACLYLLAERTDVDVDAEIAGLISRFNESVGGVNDDAGGYHDTITRTYVAGVRLFLRSHQTGGLAERVNALLLSSIGRRDWPLGFYSRELLFSVPARRGFVEPDRAPLPAAL
ncbi:hypothetical protein MZO42_03765 [Sphingomonas psychrotolerans]|uniref:Uncharacterized protein n=1 Tax=Sphingomonas psychrotolerans TaxID=1327635 RepID=A0ABU3N3G3_9SPHN|nr:hypothetical protein [Sphingomonas psychrotolerans]MDT8757805.1 hypothetical protein [Sphingomonas psychrotolerans]